MVLGQREVKRCIITKAHSGGCRLKNLPLKLYYFYISKVEFVIALIINELSCLNCFKSFIYIACVLLLYILSSVIHELNRAKVRVPLYSFQA